MIRIPSVSLDFKRLSIPEKTVFGQNVFEQMTANAAIFVTPDVALATLQSKNDTLADTAEAAEGGDHAKVAAMHAAEKDWDTTFSTEADYVDRIANGNETIILQSGFHATKSETTPASIPDVPDVKEPKVNPLPGSIHVEVEYHQGVKNYLYFVSTSNTPINLENNEFSLAKNPDVVGFISDNHRKVDFNDLTSGATLYLSVAAQNTAGTGAPSSPIAIKTL
ncbi:hypothetical protein ACFLSV_06730 [Bacteroidota bacterium]